MNQRTNRIFFALLGSAIYDQKALPEDIAEYNEELLPALIQTAKKHDLAHLIAYGLKLNKLVSNNKDIDQGIMMAIYRGEQINFEFAILCKILEEEKIPHIMLKGAVIRNLYREPWMRTSCDIDVLIKEEDVDKAAKLFAEKYNYILCGKTAHDISLFSPNKVHVELHYTLVDENLSENIAKILSEVWECAILSKNCCYRYEMPDDIFYFYHIAHMAKHFEYGGCGIRPFIDLLMLDSKEEKDTQKRTDLLNSGGLLKFTQTVNKLSRAWFLGGDMDAILQQMENYILRGGVYGSMENRVSVQKHRKGGKIKYIASRVFLPYKQLKFEYPCIIKHKYLTPFMQIVRWSRLMFKNSANRSVKELKYSVVENESMKEFLENIGL